MVMSLKRFWPDKSYLTPCIFVERIPWLVRYRPVPFPDSIEGATPMILRAAASLLITLTMTGFAWCGQDKAKDDKSPKLNREQFDKLKLGMTAKEVKEIIGGKPTLEGVIDGDGGIIYATADFSKNITVNLKGGKVVQRIGLNLLDKEPATLTKANVTKIKEGMTIKEVVDIMEKASSETDPDPMTGKGHMVWGISNKKTLQVTFMNGKVTDLVHFGFDE
jgi:hypothetical protein